MLGMLDTQTATCGRDIEIGIKPIAVVGSLGHAAQAYQKPAPSLNADVRCSLIIIGLENTGDFCPVIRAAGGAAFKECKDPPQRRRGAKAPRPQAGLDQL
ncbi:MAG: hypothetical protein N838_05800 [Thiohalocapsa sp. PB-PSB1]|nr:MAG: hypothetical protein N838_05800 [Thiohalocapsa sp. PB-PSB1]